MNIELHIEELILHGFPAVDRRRVTEALQTELARLLSETGLPPEFEQHSDLPRLEGGSFAVRVHEKPESIGALIGQSIFSGMAGKY